MFGHCLLPDGELRPDVEAAIKACWERIVGPDCEVVVSNLSFTLASSPVLCIKKPSSHQFSLTDTYACQLTVSVAYGKPLPPVKCKACHCRD